MPFKSRAQLRACYAKRSKNWNCDAWLKETKDIGCLPERLGMRKPRRCSKKTKAIRSRLKTGPRGGKYYEIKQGTHIVKVYVKRS